MTKKQSILLALVIGAGIFFRFWLIKEMPGGLFPDEAANGLDLLNILKGHMEPLYERGNGREALFFYMLAASVKLFGIGFWQHHIVSAAIGVLSILATFLLVKRLYGYNVAIVSAALMSVGTWAIVLSRTAFRANLIPLFATLVLYFLVRTAQAVTKKDRIWSAAFAGAALAGGFYSYIAFRIMPVILLVLAVLLAVIDYRQGFKWFKQYWQAGLAAIAAFIIVFAPLGHYFSTHPGSFVGRSSQVSVFNPELNKGNLVGTVLDVGVKSIKAFFVDGDLNWRHNISGLPFLHQLVSPFFGIALLVLTLLTLRFIWQAFRGRQKNEDIKHVIIIGLFWGMLLPVITTAEGIPHGLRSIGMLPAAYALSGIGLVYFAKLVLKVWHHRWMEKLYWLVAILYFATLTTVSYQQYFVYAYNHPENFYAFRSDLSAVSKYLNENPDKERTFLVIDLFSVQTVDYLTAPSGNPYHIVDPQHSWKLHLRKGDKVIFPASTLFDIKKFAQNHDNTKVIADIRNKFNQTELAILEATESDASPSLTTNADKTFSVLNLGDMVFWTWQNQSFEPWKIKIWECGDDNCMQAKLIKENNQSDHLSNTDRIETDGRREIIYEAIAYDASGNVIKDFGIIKVPKY